MERGEIRDRTTGNMEMPPRDADALIYIVDRSGSAMEGFRFAQGYLARVIDGLDEGDEIGIIFSDTRVLPWPPQGNLAKATSDSRRAAAEFVRTATGGHGSCPADAFEKAIAWAEASNGKRKLIYYIGDGGGTCRGRPEKEYIEEMFEQVTRRSTGVAEIHAIALDGGPYGEAFLHELASRNRGTFTRFIQE
jgi:hypothetical protein